MWVSSLGWEDPLEEGMAYHSSTFAWRILWTEEPGSRKGSDTTEATQQQQQQMVSTRNVGGRLFICIIWGGSGVLPLVFLDEEGQLSRRSAQQALHTGL